ncbi:MAG TPA: type II toxin-antitoxin system RelE/ParE family toxin [Caulobacteraceae bacterium]
MAWRIEPTATASRQLSKLGKVEAGRITAFLRERLAAEPRSAGKVLTGPLGGLWRYRVGDYRVLCELEDGLMRVLVVRIGYSGQVYRRAAARFQRIGLFSARLAFARAIASPWEMRALALVIASWTLARNHRS